MTDMFFWELMESEAPDKFYVNNAEHPAFLLFPKHHYLSMNKKISLYLNGVSLISTFTSEKKALERLKAIVENANYPCKVYHVSKRGRKRDEKVMFAENKVQRWVNPEPDKPARTFNITEWEAV